LIMSTKKIRNFCFISHGGAGKTILTETILTNVGLIANPGSIEKGSTASDFTPEEKSHKHSISNAYFSFNRGEYQINLIDTPGFADFRGEVAGALRMVESAVLLIDGTAGIQVNTNYVWSMAEKNKLPRFVFVNKMDLEGADFFKVLDEIQNTFRGKFVPITAPDGSGENYKGVFDLLQEVAYQLEGNQEKKVTDVDLSEFEDYKHDLLESLVELDEALMEKYFGDEEITVEELIEALMTGVASGEIIPVFAGSALKNSGVNLLLDYLVKLIPAPDHAGVVTGTWDGETVEVEIKEGDTAVALVGKTMVDPYVGKLSIFKVLTGTLSRDKEVIIPDKDVKVKLGKLFKLNGAKQEEVAKLVPGEIGAVARIDNLETSDTICSGVKIKVAEIEFPNPMYFQAVYPASASDEEKISNAINRIPEEDPTFKAEYNTETRELVIAAMGTMHVEIIKEICKRKFDVDFITKTPKVAYKETIQSKVEVEEKHKKQSGGRGQYGHVHIRMEPLPRGGGFEFGEDIFGGAIPNQYIPAVEKGIVEAKVEGVLAGYPVVDFKAVVYDGSYHPVDSSEMAFKIAASKAFKKGMEQAKPVILEPIMRVEVKVPEEFMGDIMGDMNSRRGRILGMEPDGDTQKIVAEVPQGEMFTYAIDLISITGGHGSFDMEFSHYDKVPEKLQEEIISQRKAEEA
jgi:elongation factor G